MVGLCAQLDRVVWVLFLSLHYHSYWVVVEGPRDGVLLRTRKLGAGKCRILLGLTIILLRN